VKGLQKANLGWTGASGPVDVYRGTSKIASSVSSPFTDHINVRGGGSYTYKVCPAGSSSGCSNNASVTF
jgi:thermitase